MDDSFLAPHLCLENIDYMGDAPIPAQSLHTCWKSHQKQDDLTACRLQNTAWRRWNKQFMGLPELSPAVINWNKSSDVTWLYGPKYIEQRPFEPATPPLTTANLSKLEYDDSDMESELFSVDSASSMTFSEQSVDDMSDDESYFSLKPALKPRKTPFDRKQSKKRKKVSFNYIVSSREYMNEFKFDYDFLDTRFV